MTTSFFRTDPRKSDPALVGGDDEHFRAVASALAAETGDLSRRLDELRRAPGGRGQQALDRDLEIHRRTARLRALRRFGRDLCLGRIVPATGRPLYIGRFGLTDAHDDLLLVDWRAPAAEPFFAATMAEPMGLASRRRYRWDEGLVRDFWDESLSGGTEGLALDEDSALIAGLGASRSERMRDVLSTIQADQDAIVRASSSGALVVDGGPGTGKTVVALHRAAYLLYSDPRLGPGRGGLLFIGPNEHYLAYTADVLPGLGEDGVPACTLRDLVAEGPTAVAEADERVARLKGDLRMVAAVEPAVGLYEEPPARRTVVETPWADLVLTPADWAEAFAAAEPGIAHNDARDAVWEALLDILCDQLDDVDPRLARRALSRDEELGRAMARAWPVVEASVLVADLWSVPAYLRRCAPWLSPAEVALLQREPGSPWTIEDLPLLDAARRRLGDPAAARARRRDRVRLEAQRDAMADVVDRLKEAGDEIMTWLDGEDLRNSLVDDSVREPVRPDLRAGPFAHVIVDEAQELSDAEWAMVRDRCPSGSLTIVGDRAQARRGFTEAWAQRLERAGIRRVRETGLRVNYRTPSEVMDAAAPVIRAAIPDANVPVSIRSTGLPVRTGTRADLRSLVEGWLRDHAEGTVCVIGDPSYPRGPRVQSLAPEAAKGLEFDLVVLVEPGAWGDGIRGAVDRYVAMTRTTRQLVVLQG